MNQSANNKIETLTLNIRSDLRAVLESEAQRVGVDVVQYFVEACSLARSRARG